MSAERPLSECAEDFWFAPAASDEVPVAPAVGRDALARLDRPGISVRGRNLADILRPLYDLRTATKD